MNRKLKLFILLSFCIPGLLLAKDLTLNFTNVPITEVFDAVKKQTGKSFFFNTNDIDMTTRVTINIKDQNLENALKQILKEQGDRKSVV